MNEPKPCYDGGTCRNADLVEELNARIAELENEKNMFVNLAEVDSARTIEACKRVGITFFGCDAPDVFADEILALRERIAELESLVEKGNAAIGENCDLRKRIFEIENLLKGCGYKINWGDEDDERPRLQGHGVSHYPSREDE